jgi:hypothetical protein
MADEMNYNDEQIVESLTQPDASTVVESPFCASLRSKKFFMMDELATDASHYLDSSNHCWCRETQLVVGPDGNRAIPTRCVPGRSCYSSALES